MYILKKISLSNAHVICLQTSPKDTENILRAVDWRIQQLRVREESDKPQAEKRKVDQDESSNEGISKKPRQEMWV